MTPEPLTCGYCGQGMELPRRRWCSPACRDLGWRSIRRAHAGSARCSTCGVEIFRQVGNGGGYVWYCGPGCRLPCVTPGCDRVRSRGDLCKPCYNNVHYPNRHLTLPSKDPDRERGRLRTRTQRKRAVRRGAEAEVVDRWLVGERDGWQCGICSLSVDNSLSYPEPMSASLDHIVPLSRGGSHVYANVRITHLSCNVNRHAAWDEAEVVVRDGEPAEAA